MYNSRQPRFRALVMQLAEHVGRQHIPVNEDAENIHDLLGADAVHHELIKRVVRKVYKANHCGHLDSVIDPEPTFTVLGEIRRELTSSQFSDIDQINLIDAIGEAVRVWLQILGHDDDHRTQATDNAQIISLPRAG